MYPPFMRGAANYRRYIQHAVKAIRKSVLTDRIPASLENNLQHFPHIIDNRLVRETKDSQAN